MNTIIEEIKKNVEMLKEQKEELNLLLSDYNGAVEDINHVIENCGINAAEIMMLTKQLKEYRRKRREVKIKLSEIDSVVMKFGNIKETKASKANSYTFKTSVVAQTLPKYSKYTKGKSYKFKD